jgi:asparagine synthase (glutamine-hydrolysing)
MAYDLRATDELSGGSAIERVTGLCLRGYTGNQILRDIDAVSMCHSLEVRVPFLDRTVVDTALSLPDEVKLRMPVVISAGLLSRSYRETGAKRILIDSARNLLPAGLDLQSKRGFGMPFDAWLKGPVGDVLADTTSKESVLQRRLLDPGEVETVCRSFADGRTGWAQPWLLMMLELWCREVLDRTESRKA